MKITIESLKKFKCKDTTGTKHAQDSHYGTRGDCWGSCYFDLD